MFRPGRTPGNYKTEEQTTAGAIGAGHMEDDAATMNSWHLDDAAQRQHVATIKNHPDSSEAARAREELLRAHGPLIHRLVSEQGHRDGFHRELYQAGVNGYLAALHTFEPAKGALWAYAKPWVHGAIMDEKWRQTAAAFSVPEDARQPLRGLLALDQEAGGHMEDDEAAERLGLTVQRVQELRRLMRSRRAGLDTPIPDNSYDGGNKTRTVRENVADGQQLTSKMFDSQWKTLLHEGKVVDRSTALVLAFDWDTPIHERNVRIVVSHYRDVEVAMLLDGLDERRHLPPILMNRRIWDETYYYRETDGHITVVKRAATPEIAADLDAQPDMVIPVHDEHPDLVAQRLADHAMVQNAGRYSIASRTRLCSAWDWPYPKDIPGIAKALGITERGVYKIIAKYDRALAEIRAEEE